MIPSQGPSNHENHHFSQTSKSNSIKTSQTHIFYKKQLPEKLKALREELANNHITHTIHENKADWQEIIAAAKSTEIKKVIILYNERQGENQYDQGFLKQITSLIELENIKIVSFPKTCKVKKIECLSKQKQLIEFCQNFLASKQGRRIKLASVHSIKKSVDKTERSFKSVTHVLNLGISYDKLFYQTSIYNDYDDKINSLGYESVIQILEQMKEKALQFQALRDLQSKQIFKGKKKYLILTSTNQKSIRLIQSINKKKCKNVDLILLGELKPSSQYLNDNIMLVTNNPKQIITFLKENGFDTPQIKNFQRRNSIEMRSMTSSGFRGTLLNLVRESSDSSNQNVIGVDRGSLPKEKPVHHWIIDKESPNSNKFVTTEIIPQTPPEYTKENLRILNISDIRQNEVEQSKVIEVNNGNSSSLKAQQSRNQEDYEIKMKQNPNEQKRPMYEQPPMSPRVYRHFPSNIIHEVSEEYRGSVKQSIMNIEPDISFKSIRQQLPSNLFSLPLQSAQVEENNRRIGSGLNINSQYRNTQKISSDKRVNYNSYSNYPQSAKPTTSIVYGGQSSPQSIQGNGMKIYENGSYVSYQAPSKILRKEVTSPEEVNMMSEKSNSFQNINYEPLSNIISSPPNPIKQENQTSPYANQQYLPANYKAINANRVSEVISSPSITRQTYSSPIDQLRNLNQVTTYTSPSKQAKVNSVAPSGINWDEYEKIQNDGRTIYRKKVNLDSQKQGTNQPIQMQNPRVQIKDINSHIQLQNNANSDKKTQNQINKKDNIEINQKDNKKNENVAFYPKENIAALPQESRLEPSFKPSIQTVPTVKVSAPLPKKQEPAKYSQYSIGKETKKTDKLDPKVETKKTKQNNLLNESNMYSRMSELHSDGSILRRNNIRFGVKPPQPKKPQKIEPVSIMESKLVSGIYKANNFNKKITLNRVISGQQDIQYEKTRLLHIITKFNNFHFIIHEDLSYLNNIIQNHIATQNDKIETFTGIQQLFECIRPDKIEEKFEVGFIFVRRQQLKFINNSLFPEDYFVVLIQRSEESLLSIDENSKRICIDQLKHIYLVQKIIIDSKLYQYVAYRNNKKEIQQLADKFMNTEFILQKIQTQFTSQILEFYYCQLPRITRLYLLCDEYQLPQLLKLIKIYEEFNPSFKRQSCKLICIIGDILKNDEMIMNHPKVTFISNPEQIKSYDDILKYAHHYEEDSRKILPIDHVFTHQKHDQLEKKLDLQFPGRFLIIPYTKLSEVYSKMEKYSKINAKNKIVQKNFLILHESLSHEKISVEKFAKVFMVGKVKVLQGQVVRVLNFEELFQLLKK